jgi:hypothetical protein
VCRRWRESFEAFYSDMGPRPTSGHSIDRIDNDGDYEPGNCRWATRSEQQNNRRASRYISFNGKRMTVEQWAEYLGMSRDTLTKRLNNWSVERALTEPIDVKHRR